MPRTVVDRICIRLHEAAQFHLARCRCLASIIVGVIATRSVKLNDIASQFQGKANFMSKYRRRHLFFQQVAFNQNTLAKQIVSVIALDGKLLLSIDRTTWERRGNTVNFLVLSVCSMSREAWACGKLAGRKSAGAACAFVAVIS